MENNSLTPSPLPTPDPGTNMPDFMSAPAPAPVIPTVSQMPAFGAQPAMPMPPASQPVAQPAPQPMSQPVSQAPMEPVQSAGPVSPMPQPVAQPSLTQPVEQPTSQVGTNPASTLGIIQEDTMMQQPEPAPVMQNPAEQTPFAPVEQAPAAPIEQSPMTPVEQTPAAQPDFPVSQTTPFVEAMSTTPTPGTSVYDPIPEPKKLNVKMIAIIGAASVALVGIIIAVVLTLTQPKPVTNPIDVPQPEVVTVDTSVDFGKLTAEQAETFYEATETYTTFFPDDYSADAVDYLGTSNLGIFHSYEKDSDIINIAKESLFTEKFKDKITEDNTTIDKKDGFAFVSFSPDETECGDDCLAIIFDKKVMNFYTEPYTDIYTGITSQIDHLMFIDHSRETVEKYMPLVAAIFMNGEKVYSSSFVAGQNGELTFVINSIIKNKAGKIAKKNTFFKVITTGEFLYLPDKTVETVL